MNISFEVIGTSIIVLGAGVWFYVGWFIGKRGRAAVFTPTGEMQSTGEYLAMILHHIRTPLTGMMWAVKEVWKRAPEGSEEKAKLLKIYDENIHILSAVEELLSSSRAAAGRVTYDFEVTETNKIEQLILRGLSEMSSSAHEKNISLHIETRPLVNKPIKVDLEKVISIAQTLFENAVMYSDPGGDIAVLIEEDGGHLVFEIADTGIGIPEKDCGKIFTQFFRAENAQKKVPTSYGVGLFLAKTFVNAHGGTIAFAENDENGGKGTIFTVKLPLLQQK